MTSSNVIDVFNFTPVDRIFFVGKLDNIDRVSGGDVGDATLR